MPIYEYKCAACESDFELLIRSDEKPECPSCGDDKVEKQFSVPAAHGSSNDLPLAGPGGCGRPQCGTGGCQGMM